MKKSELFQNLLILIGILLLVGFSRMNNLSLFQTILIPLVLLLLWVSWYLRKVIYLYLMSFFGKSVFVTKDKDGRCFGKCPTCRKKIEYEFGGIGDQAFHCDFCGAEGALTTDLENLIKNEDDITEK